MVAELEYAEVIPTNIDLPPVVVSKRNEHPEKRLTALYVRDNRNYEIECKNSPCRTKCHFLSSEFGEAIFDRESETFIASTKPIDDHYFKRLKIAVRQWKIQFSDF